MPLVYVSIGNVFAEVFTYVGLSTTCKGQEVIQSKENSTNLNICYEVYE